MSNLTKIRSSNLLSRLRGDRTNNAILRVSDFNTIADAINDLEDRLYDVTTATATADGLTTGLLTGTNQFVTVTSGNAAHIVCLPEDSTCPVGTTIKGWVGANGFELRSLASNTTQVINDVTAGVTNEAAIPATTMFTVTKVADLTWVLTAVDELGAVITAIVPDAV